MAVTGDIFKSLTFDGESSRDYGVYITGQAVYNAPERDVEMVTIPGRSGAFALDKGRFENIEVTYPAGVFANTETEFAKAISDFRNMLCSRKGYCRLTDEYNPDEYRLAVYKSGLEVDPVQLKAGQFDITFECKPQRYLMSGQNKFIVGEWGDTEIETGDIVEIDNTGGSIEVKSAEVALEPQQDLHGYDKPWAGGAGKNKLGFKAYGTQPYTSAGITYTPNLDANGNVISLTLNGTQTSGAETLYYFYNTTTPLGVTPGTAYTISIGDSAVSNLSIRVGKGTDNSYIVSTTSNSVTFTPTVDSITVRISAAANAGAVFNNVKIYPMLRLSTESADFEPYTNICPITGASDVEIYADGKYGGEIEWNQLIQNGNFADTSSWTANNASVISMTVSDGVASVTSAANGDYRMGQNIPNCIDNHKYFLCADIKAGTANQVALYAFLGAAGANQYINLVPTDTNWHTYTKIARGYTGSVNQIRLQNGVANTTNQYKNIQLIDLTQCFGSTKADEIYAMEQQTAGSGVAYFKSLFYKDYYAYDAGTITCVSAVNGDPYEHTTTSLGTTVYGGSVDVVAGTGTVTYGYVDLGTLTWTKEATTTGNYRFYATGSNVKPSATADTKANALCSNYQIITPNQTWFGTATGIAINTANGRLLVCDPAFNGSTAAAFKTGVSGVQLVYELATPTTLTLTPTEIELIKDINYIWSDPSPITIEYGTGPDFIINPTLFGCGPLIEAKGYGDISFNGHTIKLANGAIGTVNLWQETRGGTFNGSITKTFVTGQFEPTDTFSFTVTHMFTLFEDYPSITNTNANAVNDFRDNNDGSVTYWIDLPCTFTVGTTGQITNTATYDFGSGKKVISDMDVSYDSTSGTVVYTVATTTQGQPSIAGTMQGFYISECNADSTLNRLGDPTYIDCDLGEAYKINGGDVVGLNSFVDLGSKLPELAPGNNEFTVSNTFTEVAVTPRWWTV